MRSIASYYYSYVHCVFPPNSLSSFFVYEHSFIYSYVQWILYMPFGQKSSTHSYPHTHPAHTNLTSHPVTFTQLINTFTDAPPPHSHTHRITTTLPLALCTKWLPWKRFCFCFCFFSSSKTHSVHAYFRQ